MNPILFFDRAQIFSSKDFLFTYAVDREIENAIAYAEDLRTLNAMNKTACISAIITTDDLKEKVIESKGVIVSNNPKKDFYNLHNFMVREG